VWYCVIAKSEILRSPVASLSRVPDVNIVTRSSKTKEDPVEPIQMNSQAPKQRTSVLRSKSDGDVFSPKATPNATATSPLEQNASDKDLVASKGSDNGLATTLTKTGRFTLVRNEAQRPIAGGLPAEMSLFLRKKQTVRRSSLTLNSDAYRVDLDTTDGDICLIQGMTAGQTSLQMNLLNGSR
jgi:hypothetical protein